MNFTKKIFLAAALLFSLILLMIVPAFASYIYDAARDFSLSQNPNGAWSYGYSNSLTGPLILYDTPVIDGILNIWKNDNLAAPNVIQQPTSLWGYNGSTLSLEPGFNGEYSLIRFTTIETRPRAVNSFYYFRAIFTDLSSRHDPPDTTDLHILLTIGSQTHSLFQGSLHYGEVISTRRFKLGLRGGTTIDFAVGPGFDGNNNYDATGIRIIIAHAPLPATVLFLSTGLGALVLFGRRKRAIEN
jgi:hypothetical protein